MCMLYCRYACVLSRETPLVTHHNDFYGDGEGDLVAVSGPQLLDYDENHTADQGEDQ